MAGQPLGRRMRRRRHIAGRLRIAAEGGTGYGSNSTSPTRSNDCPVARRVCHQRFGRLRLGSNTGLSAERLATRDLRLAQTNAVDVAIDQARRGRLIGTVVVVVVGSRDDAFDQPMVG